MGSFLNNSQAYTLQAQNEVSVLLSNFSTDYVFNVIEDILQSRYNRFDSLQKPNLVLSFEDNFKTLLIQYPDDKENIHYVRQETYKEIIGLISKEFQFEVRYDDSTDLFTLASCIYDFFVANYNPYISFFFSKIITKEKDGIYNALKLEEQRKSKDSTTIYNKKLYNDPKMALINANLTRVLDYLMAVDFDAATILSSIYGNNVDVVNMFMNHVFPYNSLYKSAYCSLLKVPEIYPLIITAIRLHVQRMNMPADNTTQYLGGEENV